MLDFGETPWISADLTDIAKHFSSEESASFNHDDHDLLEARRSYAERRKSTILMPCRAFDYIGSPNPKYTAINNTPLSETCVSMKV
jgi:hypothetical protein